MSRKENADPVAAAMAQKRWDKASEGERKKHASKMAKARWAGHVAKRPASSRKKAGKVKKAG